MFQPLNIPMHKDSGHKPHSERKIECSHGVGCLDRQISDEWKDMYNIYTNITGQCSKGVAPSISHPPIPLYSHLTLPRSLTCLPNMPLSHDSQTTGLPSGPASHKPENDCASWERNLSLYIRSDTTILMSRGDGETHIQLCTVANPSILLHHRCGRI